jgi:hypothetical protein
MANTTFSGPVTSTNGFIGSVTGPVVATTLSASGAVILSGLPTSDPTVAGQLWNNLGVLNVSAG